MTQKQDDPYSRVTHSLCFEDNTLMPELVGTHNTNLHIIEEALSISTETRGNEIRIAGYPESIAAAEEIFTFLWDRLKNKQPVTSQDVKAAIRFYKKHLSDHKDSLSGGASSKQSTDSMPKDLTDRLKNNKTIHLKKKSVSPRSPKQAEYIEAMDKHDMVFGIGPAGTGKTYLAVAMALSLYQNKDIDRMVFCRPAVEAGEKLGFLPGDMQEKIDPYLRPIYDALHDLMPVKDVEKLIEDGSIEIAPLAFMRGRTLKNAFVVLDEAQNTTSMQMKMFLTRMGERTHMVINGDTSQIDLPPGTQSGLVEAQNILTTVPEISCIQFGPEDVIRHQLVSKIIHAYDTASNHN